MARTITELLEEERSAKSVPHKWLSGSNPAASLSTLNVPGHDSFLLRFRCVQFIKASWEEGSGDAHQGGINIIFNNVGINYNQCLYQSLILSNYTLTCLLKGAWTSHLHNCKQGSLKLSQYCTRIVISFVLLKHLPLMASVSFIARSTQLSFTHKVAHENMHRNFKTLKMRLQSHFIGINLWTPKKTFGILFTLIRSPTTNNNEKIIFYQNKHMASLIDYQSTNHL